MLVGGTFDPVHIAHTGSGEAAREQLLPGGALLFVPAARSPHKGAGPVASDSQRVEMLEAATRDMPRTGVWTDELDRANAGEASYWVDTLRRLRGMVGDEVTVWFVVGQDQAVRLHTWHEARDLVRLARPAVVARGTEPSEDPLANLAAWTDRERERFAAVRCGPWEVSSSAIRERVRERGTPKGDGPLSAWLSPGVNDLIAQWRLYRE